MQHPIELFLFPQHHKISFENLANFKVRTNPWNWSIAPLSCLERLNWITRRSKVCLNSGPSEVEGISSALSKTSDQTSSFPSLEGIWFSLSLLFSPLENYVLHDFRLDFEIFALALSPVFNPSSARAGGGGPNFIPLESLDAHTCSTSFSASRSHIHVPREDLFCILSVRWSD